MYMYQCKINSEDVHVAEDCEACKWVVNNTLDPVLGHQPHAAAARTGCGQLAAAAEVLFPLNVLERARPPAELADVRPLGTFKQVGWHLASLHHTSTHYIHIQCTCIGTSRHPVSTWLCMCIQYKMDVRRTLARLWAPFRLAVDGKNGAGKRVRLLK